MKLISRFLLVVYSIISIVFWFLGFFITIFKLPYAKSALYQAGNVLGWPFLQHPAMWMLVLLVCAVSFLFNVYMLLVAIRGDREFKSVVRENSVGTIKISATTFENIALNVLTKLGGVKDARAVIRLKGEDVEVTVRAVFLSDVNIPAICEEGQKRIVQAMEQATGVKAKHVKIVVDGVQNAYKGRVE